MLYARIYRTMAYELSIEIFGTGEDPQHRSHWGFVIHRPASYVGDLLHVKLIDLNRLWYQFEQRSGTPLRTMQAIGKVKVADLSEQQRQHAIQVITASPAPRDGKKRVRTGFMTPCCRLRWKSLCHPAHATSGRRWLASQHRLFRKLLVSFGRI